MRVTCPECDQRFKVSESAASRKVRCPKGDGVVPVRRRRVEDDVAETRSKRRSDGGQGKNSLACESNRPGKQLSIAAVVLLVGSFGS